MQTSQLGDVLGYGAYGVVHKLGAETAIKIGRMSGRCKCKDTRKCKCSSCLEALEDKGVVAEINTLKSLNHDNIMKLITSGKMESGSPYFTMALAETNLWQFVYCDKRPEIALDIALQLFAALTYLHHTVRMAHCDVTLGNILLFKGNHIRLSDFGAACKVDDRGFIPSTDDVWVCITTQLFASPACYHCEEFHKQPNSCMCDVWAAGICILMICMSVQGFCMGDDAPHVKRCKEDQAPFRFRDAVSCEVINEKIKRDDDHFAQVQPTNLVDILFQGPLKREDIKRWTAAETLKALQKLKEGGDDAAQ